MTTVFDEQGVAHTLSARDFVGAGGEGSVYARGDRAFKVYHDPTRAIPAAKVRALAAIADPRVLAPRELLVDEHGVVVGFVAPFLAAGTPLCRYFAAAFRDAHGIGDNHVHALLLGLHEVLVAAHAVGLQVVDLNPLNVLVGPDHATPYLIDVDSWQAPGFPATAVMDAVRDRHAAPGHFDAGTDWFAFAVLAFQLLVGVHPYRGAHPQLPTMEARMLAHASAFRPEVKLPPSAFMAPAAIAPPLRSWLSAVLDGGSRAPLPASALLLSAPLPQVCPVPRAGLRATLVDGRLRLEDAATGRLIPCDLRATAVATDGGRTWALVGASLVEVELRAVGHDVLATTRPLCQALPLATQLFRGLAIQRSQGEVWAFLFPERGRVYQVAVPELRGLAIIDAHLDGRVATFDATDAQGAPRRVVLDFARSFDRYVAVASSAATSMSP